MRCLAAFLAVLLASVAAVPPVNPFNDRELTAAYVYASNLREEWTARHDRLHVDDADVASLMARGFFANAVGVVFPLCHHLLEIARQLVSSSPNKVQAMGANIVMDNDLPKVENDDDDHCDESSLQDDATPISDIKRVGYHKIEDWGLSSKFLRRLTYEAEWRLEEWRREEKGKSIEYYVGDLETLTKDPEGRQLLTENLLPQVALDYLGPGAELSGFGLQRISGGDIPLEKYISALWHHDRCGKRLKAFLFLSNVHDDNHPTEIARDSHRTIFYSYHRLKESRYNDSWVRSNYDVDTMTGPAGGGFIFDTNSIHRGGGFTPKKSSSLQQRVNQQQRTVIIFEMNDRRKSIELQALRVFNHSASDGIPCPSQQHNLAWPLEINETTGRPTFKTDAKMSPIDIHHKHHPSHVE